MATASGSASGLSRPTRSSTIKQLDAINVTTAALSISAVAKIQAIARGHRTRKDLRKRWGKVTKTIRTTGSLLKGVRIRRMSELPLAISRERVTTKVEGEEELRKLRLWEQGDESMYTREALEQRYRNRADKLVWRYLNIWWATAMAHGKLQVTDEMPKSVYVDLYVNVCKALLEPDEEWDEAEARRLVEGAWEEDSRGTNRLTRSMFNDSL